VSNFIIAVFSVCYKIEMIENLHILNKLLNPPKKVLSSKNKTALLFYPRLTKKARTF